MQHPDEGTIHTWLDGQLPRDEAAAIEAHVAECRPCADAVAEARGLIAASSRILMALDAVPRGVTPKQDAPSASDRGVEVAPVPALADQPPNAVVDLRARAAAAAAQRAPRRQRRWVSGPSLAAAAAIIVAVGSFAVLQNRAGEDFLLAEADSQAVASGPSSDAASTPIAPSAASAPPPPAATVRANEAPAAPVESRRQTFADRAERDQSQPATTAPGRALATDARGAVSSAKVGVQDSAVSRPAESTRLTKEQEKTSAEPTVARQRLASTQALADSQRTKPDTTTVTIIRGRELAVANAPQVPAPAPAPQVQQGQRKAAPRDARSDGSDLSRSATTGFVRGRVADGNGTGLSNAMVTIAGTTTGVTTNDRGEFSLGGLAAGQAQVRVRRLGYDPDQRTVSVSAGQTVTIDVILRPSPVSLQSVVVTGSAEARERRALGASVAAAPAVDRAPGAAVTANESNAIGCYELSITLSSARTRTAFVRVPRRVALEGEILPANADGIWYRARDLARTGAIGDGLWRPVGTDGVELEWIYGTKVARIRLTGPARALMRGTVDEMDRSAATTESGTVVSSWRSCE